VVVQQADDLGSAYTLEVVAEKRFAPLRLSRISRVTAVNPTGAPALPAEPTSMEKLTPAEREKIRQEYFDHFIKNLP